MALFETFVLSVLVFARQIEHGIVKDWGDMEKATPHFWTEGQRDMLDSFACSVLGHAPFWIEGRSDVMDSGLHAVCSDLECFDVYAYVMLRIHVYMSCTSFDADLHVLRSSCCPI